MTEKKDPTQSARDLVKKGLSYLVPENSPLAKSGESSLTPEARAKMEAERAAGRAPADLPVQSSMEEPSQFVDPALSSPQAAPAQQMMTPSSGLNPVATYRSGVMGEANVLDEVGKQQADVYGEVQKQAAGIDQQIQEIRTAEQVAAEKFEKDDQETRKKIDNFQLEPKNFFAGKNTWQKILGGLGMFLGSITPEGARNVASIIDKEIDRDLEIQKQQLLLMKDQRNEAVQRFKMKLDRYGNDKLAMMSMKKDALMAAELKLKQIESTAKGPLAREKAKQGLAAIEMKQQELSSSMMKAWAEMQSKASKGSIPGFTGRNEAMAKDVAERVAAERAATSSINEMKQLLKEGASMPLSKRKALALQVRDNLAAQIAKAQAGGKYSDFEYQKAQDQIPDITSLMQSGSVDMALLDGLAKRIRKEVDAYAGSAGFSRELPVGARKM